MPASCLELNRTKAFVELEASFHTVPECPFKSLYSVEDRHLGSAKGGIRLLSRTWDIAVETCVGAFRIPAQGLQPLCPAVSPISVHEREDNHLLGPFCYTGRSGTSRSDQIKFSRPLDTGRSVKSNSMIQNWMLTDGGSAVHRMLTDGGSGTSNLYLRRK